MTHYFITSQIDDYTSAIEIAEIQRLHLFDDLGQQAYIVTKNHVRNAAETWRKLGIAGRVINLFQYFQGRQPSGEPIADTTTLIKQLTNLPIHDNVAWVDGKVRVQITMAGSEIYYVDYIDQWGFTDRRDFYEGNRLSYSEYFDDNGRLNSRAYYDQSGQVVIVLRYHGGANNQPVLSLIMLTHDGRHLQFDDLDQLMAYFLDCLAAADDDPRFYCDREDIAVKPFKLMQQPAKRYVILHSTFTENAQRNGKFYPYVKIISTMTDKLTGIISSTINEAADVHARIPGTKAYTVPVSYLPNERFNAHFDFSKRKPYQLIAVARVTKLKQLDHIIDITQSLHEIFPYIDLKIYGYEDSTSDPTTVNQLHRSVIDNHADSFIHFCGYVQDLTTVYETADLLVLTSQYEGFSMAVLEALGHGCPVVSYDINYGPSEMVKNSVNGQLIKPDDTKALFETIKHLLMNRDLLKIDSEQAMVPLHKFSEDAVKQDWLQVINEK